MRPGMLHVVTAIANPIRWESRKRLYETFARHMLSSGVNLTVIECAYGDRDYECDDVEGVTHIGVRARTLVWTKENLLNLAIQRLPADAKYIAWIDADVEFRNPDWASATVHALQQYDIVQPWSEALDLGPRGAPMLVKGRHVQTSFCKVWRDLGNIPREPYAYAHPGYAWAARREVLDDLGGLIETAALGSADHHMAMALIGDVERSLHGQSTWGYKQPIRQWASLAERYVATNIGYVEGTIEHQFHGAKDKRKYVERWDILVRNAFDPFTDLKRNSYGVLELAGSKPALRRDIDSYFRQRDEDANCL